LEEQLHTVELHEHERLRLKKIKPTNTNETRTIPHGQKPIPIPVIPTKATNNVGNKQHKAHRPTTPIPAKSFFKKSPPFHRFLEYNT
jgi:hypothetical protein